jgi:DNA-binding Lrp family transcriptional regulator
MKNGTLKTEDILEMIRKDAAKTSQLDVSKRIGVSPSYLGEMLKGTRAISDRVARYYGFDKATVFVKAG